jgi:hypothetical protein
VLVLPVIILYSYEIFSISELPHRMCQALGNLLTYQEVQLRVFFCLNQEDWQNNITLILFHPQFVSPICQN